MKKKTSYEVPETELLLLTQEMNILSAEDTFSSNANDDMFEDDAEGNFIF